MGNILIATPELSDAATLYPSTETAAGPAANLQRMQPTDVWQGGPFGSIDVDLGSAVEINLFALLHTTMFTAGTVTISTSDTQGGLATPDYSSGALALTDIGPDGHFFHFLPAGITNQWVRFDMSLVGAMTAGRLYIANALQPDVNFEYGWADGFDDDAVIDRAGGGALHPGGGANRPVSTLTLNVMSEAERHAIRGIHRSRGARKDVLFIMDPEAAENISDGVAYVLMQRRRDTIQTAFNQHQVAYQLTAL